MCGGVGSPRTQVCGQHECFRVTHRVWACAISFCDRWLNLLTSSLLHIYYIVLWILPSSYAVCLTHWPDVAVYDCWQTAAIKAIKILFCLIIKKEMFVDTCLTQLHVNLTKKAKVKLSQIIIKWYIWIFRVLIAINNRTFRKYQYSVKHVFFFQESVFSLINKNKIKDRLMKIVFWCF